MGPSPCLDFSGGFTGAAMRPLPHGASRSPGRRRDLTSPQPGSGVAVEACVAGMAPGSRKGITPAAIDDRRQVRSRRRSFTPPVIGTFVGLRKGEAVRVPKPTGRGEVGIG